MKRNALTKDQIQLVHEWHNGRLNTQLNVLISPYQSEMIESECTRLNMNRNAFVRHCLLNYWLSEDQKN